MSQPRHKRVKPRSERLRIGLAAGAVALTTVAATVVANLPHDEPDTAAADAPSTTSTDDRAGFSGVSRSGERPEILKGLAEQGKAGDAAPTSKSSAPTITPPAVGHRYLTEDLNVWTGPGEQFHLQTVLPTGSKVAISGAVKGDWAQIIFEGRARWVRAAYLSDSKPVEIAAAGGVTEAPCRLGTEVESGLTPNAIRVYRSVCAQFPEVTSYGGVRADGGEHGEGRAIDIMVSSSTLGDAIADWVRANASALGASEVLWAQHIWTVERGSEGWRVFEDRGSATANHFDHVHVTVYG